MPITAAPLPNRMESARLVLATLQFTDAADLNTAIRESLNELSPWLSWAVPTHTLRETQNRIQEGIAAHRDGREAVYTVRTKGGRIVGEARLVARPDSMGNVIPAYELNLWIRSTEARKGYGSEAMKLMADYSISTLKAQRISAACSSANTGCIRMMEKAGLTQEARLKNAHRVSDEALADTLIYARTV